PTGPTPTPSNTPVPGACTNKAQFIADTTIPDGTVMTPGKTFKKTWRLKNIGTCTWTTSYSLVFDSGEQMGGAASVALTSQVKPGQSSDISVDLTAPSANGTYRGYWKLANEGGTRFGLGTNADKPWWVEIKVSGGPTATPSPTPTGPTPTPSNTPTPTATTDPGACTNKVKFIADVNVPDGTVMTAGKTFTKTWRVQNAGTCTWTTSYALVFESGDQMNGAGSATLSAQVKPGQTVDLSIALTAPSANGTYRGNWMLANESGAHFGLGTNADKPWWVEIKVTGGTGWKIDRDTANVFRSGSGRTTLPLAAGVDPVGKALKAWAREGAAGPVTFIEI
ncbi:MAG: NBR1-Ig-like domain-containing protein, partial [Chloroflexota bacterium]